MRLIQLIVPEGKQDAVLRMLDDEEIEYAVTDETSGREYSIVVTFALPRAAVESVLESLSSLGIDKSGITIVSDAETIISSNYEELEARYVEDTERSEDLIAREELQTKAKDMISSLSTYATLTVVSALIATVGLLLDSPATVVGSMVIAPLIGPAMAASVGTVVADDELFRRGVKFQILGIVLAIGSAALFALFVRYTNLVPPGMDPMQLAEVGERATPSFLILVVALGAGVAGILSLMTGVSTALVGVMIAVALIPPAAAVGVGLAFFIPRLIVGAGVFVLVNVLSINLAALLVLWRSGYRPDRWFHAERTRTALIRQVAVLLVVIAVLSMFLGGVTYDSYAAATTEQDVRSAVNDELAEMSMDATLIELEVHRTGTIPPLDVNEVIVTVGVPPGETAPSLAERLHDSIAETLGEDVPVRVRFEQVESAG